MKKLAFVMYGQGGVVVDAVLSGDGIGRLVKRIKAVGIDVYAYNWSDYKIVADKIKAAPKDTIIIVGGASLGANMSPWVGAAIGGRPIDYMFGIQPSLYGGKYPITDNVRKVLCIYNPIRVITGGLGAYCWEMAIDNKVTAFKSKYSYSGHPGDNVENVQTAILADIIKL